ncbi:hypothetical protein [Streptomyces collinus]
MAAVDGVSDKDLIRLLLQTIAVGFFPSAVVTIVAFSAFRRWNSLHEERTRQQLDELTKCRQEMTAEFNRRAKELAEREERVNRHAALGRAQARELVEQLRTARSERAEAILQRDRLQEDFDVLAGEYNGLVLGEMDERAAQFTRPRRPPRPVRERRRERVSAEGNPTRLFIGQRFQADQEQHARPAEG